MLRIFQKPYVLPLLIILLSIPSFRFLLKPGMYWNMQDDMQIVRQLEFDKCLKDGQIPCRWSPDLGYGYGFPEFNFYPALPYLVGELFHLTGSNFMETVKLTAIVQFILAGLAMYFLVLEVYKNRLSSLIASAFYLYAPYRALNVYVRGAMNEAWASIFFPLIFLYIYKIILKPNLKNSVLLALSISGLLLSHNPMALIFAPICVIWSLFWLHRNNLFKKPKTILNPYTFLILSALFSICLSAFFTLPLLAETKYVQIETMFKNYYSYLAHFKSVKQIFFSNYWSDGASKWVDGIQSGDIDGMSFMVGFLHWIIPTIITLSFMYLSIKSKKVNKQLLLPTMLSILGFTCLFMIHSRSAPIWATFKIIQNIQFPWRFLNPASFLLSLAAASFPIFLKDYFKSRIVTVASILLVISVISINYSHFYPVTKGPLTDQEKFSGIAWRNLITSGIYDYLPKTARIAPLGPATEYVDDITPSTTLSKITDGKHGTDWLLFNIYLPDKSKVTISQLGFPGFKIRNNGKLINYQIEPEFGRMVVDLPAGDNQIYVKLTNTPIRTISNVISLISWILTLSFLFLWKKLPSKK